MRVVLTGATSFIGQAVMEELLGRGHQVLAVVRPDSPGLLSLKKKRQGNADLKLVLSSLAGIRQITADPQLEEGAQAWLHLGWEGAGSANRTRQELQRKNIGYALEALETAAELGAERFLFSGSQAEYGICHGRMIEETPCHPVSEYGKDKLLVCRQGLEESKRLGLDYLHARIFSVYGPGDHPWSLVATCLKTFSEGGHIDLGDCTQLWNYLYVTDAARALTQLLLGKASAGVYNVAGEDTRPLRSYIEEIYRFCGEKGTYAYGRRPPNAEGVVSLNPDIGKLKEATGFCPRIDFQAGIGLTFQKEKEQ